MTPASWSPQHGLDPTPPQAREWLEKELNGLDYQSSWLDSVIEWILDKLGTLPDGSMSGLSAVVTALVAFVVIALLVWVLPKVRRESRAARSGGAVMEDATMTARAYRDRATQALRDKRYDDAVLDAFRAIARDMSDRALLADAPGITAHEASVALAPCFPDHGDRLARAADLFDAVRYGHRHASAEQAAQIQRLDTELATARPVVTASSSSSLQDLPV